MTRHARIVAFVSSLALAACADSSPGTPDDDTGGAQDTTPDALFGDLTETDAIEFDTAVGPPDGSTADTQDTTDVGPGGDTATGGFGAACQGNRDCVSGFCVEGPEGFVCTKSCESECPDEYDCRGVQSGSADTVFLCMPRVVRVCVPCKADYQCPGGACLDIGGSGECSFPCADDSACPNGYVCEADAAGTHAGSWCRPRSGSCDCTPDLAGAVRTCTTTNDHGTCYGTESCDATLGWTGCSAATAVPEVCDGRDNDCDALVDDGVEQGTPCENTVAGVGTCRGVTVCVGTDGLVCTAATPEVEACDFRDNDCDGEIDEPFKDAAGEFTLPEHCGTCNNDCSDKIANGTGRCEIVEGASPVCVVASCDPDYVELNRFQCALPPDVSCLPCAGPSECYDGTCTELDGQRVCVVPCGDAGACQDGYECRPVDGASGADRCMPISGSCLCNPTTDGQVRTCVRASVSGTCYGQEVCDAATGWSGCTARVPSEEVCNGVDDDCSSAVDDVLGRGDTCAITNTFGTCVGVRDCGDGAALECIGATPAAEICNYEDDDCDGRTDEGFDTLYASCATGVGACERYGFVACRVLGDGVMCNATAGQPSDEKCDGVDNDCDSETDETFGDLGDVCFTGVGACRGVGTVTCNGSGNGTVCNAVAGAGTTEACDLIDNDCDGATDNGFKNAAGNYATDKTCGNCFTDCTVIYDKPHATGECADGPPPQCRMVCSGNHFDLNEVPDDGCELALDTGAIYVGADSGGAADDATCGLGPRGTGGHPCASIGYGIGRAQALGRTRVLVADALYVEQVILVNGISLFGGYRADTWERHVASTTTTLRGPEGVGDRKAIVAIGITSATTVEGFVINAANAVSAGANSYAIYVRNSTGALDIHDNLVFAGLGGPGSTGSGGASGDNGVNGTVGLPTIHYTACTGSPGRNGGAGGAKSCPGFDGAGTTVVSGGKGGDSVCPARNVHEGSGTGGSNGGGAGGSGGWGHNSDTSSCSPSNAGPETGVPGADATVLLSRDGAAGLGCSDLDGVLTDGEWRGVAGNAGGHGQHGAGGGGGGAGSGGALSGGNGYDISGTGGGGGSGGCAGARGGGGQPGGGSFGVFIAWTTGTSPVVLGDVPQVHDNVISRNQGGPGGAGGNGGAGGDPGQGALGGELNNDHLSPTFCVFGGAKGGFGSRGGHGGGGGGGCGGVSFDIFVWGLNGVGYDFTDNVFANGDTVTGGEPGAGGNSSNTTRKGFPGQRGESGRIKLVN